MPVRAGRGSGGVRSTPGGASGLLRMDGQDEQKHGQGPDEGDDQTHVAPLVSMPRR
jgi:hypothetical protein